MHHGRLWQTVRALYGWGLRERAVKLLFPARMVEKVDLIPTSARKELERRVQRFMSLDDLPTTHGGKREPYECPVHGRPAKQ